MMAMPFRILFEKTGKPISQESIKKELSAFSKSYDRVVKTIIDNSANLRRDIFNFNVATLMPTFGMTRTTKSVFYGMRIEKDVPVDSIYHVLDVCWEKFGDALEDLKKHINRNISNRNRAILELPEETKNFVVSMASELFDKLEWTTVSDIYIGRVGASKILFAIYPELALPVDNTEWDYVFRTHNYGKVLSTMIDEIKEWSKIKRVNLETLSEYSQATLPSVYNVMAMAARPKR